MRDATEISASVHALTEISVGTELHGRNGRTTKNMAGTREDRDPSSDSVTAGITWQEWVRRDGGHGGQEGGLRAQSLQAQ